MTSLHLTKLIGKKHEINRIIFKVVTQPSPYQLQTKLKVVCFQIENKIIHIKFWHCRGCKSVRPTYPKIKSLVRRFLLTFLLGLRKNTSLFVSQLTYLFFYPKIFSCIFWETRDREFWRFDGIEGWSLKFWNVIW